ncbi:hypothetical protein H5P28_11510 [Ruficoccus amylovorans]|uniref:Uncharacterized protein n=1 Tax=Ruficoccus amylovorans TaxID=1804625 RepID=A0A842HH49_9BACT|nr:hypothetical protein [Ruficoccus amylovorans]MBC2594884.1 hypothetical protein [Ruficoccus amylovorans]
MDTQAYRKEREARPEAMCSRQKVFLALSALIPEITLIFESDELPETLSQSEMQEIVKYVAAYQQALEEDHITEPTARLAFARGVLEAEGGSSTQ